MKNNGGSVMDANLRSGNSEGGLVSILRTVMLISTLVGAIGSLAFMFRAGQQTPRLLLVAFTIWILAPFVLLFWISRMTKQWPVPARIILYSVVILISLVSLTVYSGLVDVKPAGSANAFVYVAVPPVSFVSSLVAAGLVRVLSTKRSNP